MRNKRLNRLLEYWKREEKQPFVGWDFSYIKDRCIMEKPSWSYEKIARELIKASNSLLDLGTGGGEKLLEFKDILPNHTTVTEEYPPNFHLARKRLEPLHIKVVESKASLEEQLPFMEGEFDLVINRHTGFNISEVERVLSPGSVFLTEQVDGNNLDDLSESFDVTQPWKFFTLDFVLEKIRATNLVLETAQEWTGKAIFKDVGAIVYFLKAIPWIVPNFSVKRNYTHLLKLQEKLDKYGELCFSQKLLLVKARKN